MNYYLVGLFDKSSYKFLQEIQANLSSRFNLYEHLPMLHITLEVINTPDIEALDYILRNLLQKYSKFNIEVNGAICFDPPYKSVNLKVENKGIIKTLCEEINSTLKSNNFKVRADITSWDLHISLANTNFSLREWSAPEYVNACNLTKAKHYKRTIIVESLQLWKPINDENEMVLKTYELL